MNVYHGFLQGFAPVVGLYIEDEASALVGITLSRNRQAQFVVDRLSSFLYNDLYKEDQCNGTKLLFDFRNSGANLALT